MPRTSKITHYKPRTYMEGLMVDWMKEHPDKTALDFCNRISLSDDIAAKLIRWWNERKKIFQCHNKRKSK